MSGPARPDRGRVTGLMGSFIGPIIGAFALNLLAEKIRDYGEYHVLVFGLIALVVARFAPNGLLGLWQRFRFSRPCQTSKRGVLPGS